MSVGSIISMCVPLVEPLGYDIVDVETSPKGQVLRIFVDRLDRMPVTLDDCSAVTHAVQDTLDSAMVAYERLEVSSPGVDRALTRPAHFLRFVGSRVVVKLSEAVGGRVSLEGTLDAADATSCELNVDGFVHKLAYTQIKRARIKSALNWNGLEKE